MMKSTRNNVKNHSEGKKLSDRTVKIIKQLGKIYLSD